MLVETAKPATMLFENYLEEINLQTFCVLS